MKSARVAFSLCCLALFSGNYAIRPGTASMLQVKGGLLIPFFKNPEQKTFQVVPNTERVDDFFMDKYAVSNRDYLEFVTKNPTWRKSNIKRIFAESNYLQEWKSDLDPGDTTLDSPIVYVSWFGARAFAKWKDKRLPTMKEWEYAASSPLRAPEGYKGVWDEKQKVLEWNARGTGSDAMDVKKAWTNELGFAGLKGQTWEWVDDVSEAMMTSDSRELSSPKDGLFCGAGALSSNDFSDYPAFLRYAFRSSLKPRYCLSSLGFRCASDTRVKDTKK